MNVKIENGYPMVKLMCYELSDIDDFREMTIDELKSMTDHDGGWTLALRNLEDPTKCKEIIGGDMDLYDNFASEIKGREEFFILYRKKSPI